MEDSGANYLTEEQGRANQKGQALINTEFICILKFQCVKEDVRGSLLCKRSISQTLNLM